MSKSQPDQKDLQNPEYLHALRHTAEHVLTYAMHRLYGADRVIMAMGPATDDGFYFDFDTPEDFKVTEDMFRKIEKEMKKLIQQNFYLEKVKVRPEVAQKIFAKNFYKLEWLAGIEDSQEPASLYLMGSQDQIAADKKLLQKAAEDVANFESEKLACFIDLCKGPHVERTGEIKAFKLLSIAGAYWHGDEKNKMLTRVYGTAFADSADLDEYLRKLELAEQNNHRKLGKEMELFAVIPEIGQGLPVWLPKGYAMRRVIEDYMIQLERGYGYEHILTPHINRKELFETSGHLGFYDESMYPPIEFDDEVYYLKPMNCPAGMMVYNLKPHSYRELPMKVGELGTVYRYEKSGELQGLQRVRGFTQNDAHIFCTKDQLKAEMHEVMEMLQVFYKDIGFDNYSFRLSISDPEDEKFKACGAREDWLKAEAALREMLQEEGVEFEEAAGEAAFYGPKIDVQAVNVFGKEDSISTIQVDFNLPERFDINYVNEKGEKERPFVIHRALIGSFERFFAFLIEHHGGNFPVWFAPVQVKILPIADRHNQYVQDLHQDLLKAGVRVESDLRSERLSAKIRDAELQKVPYILVVGDQEVEKGEVNVRRRGEKEQKALKIEEFKQKLLKEVEEKV